MASLLVRLVLPVLLGIVGRQLASTFSGSCPGNAAGFMCQHWNDIASFAGTVLGMFGFAVKRPSDLRTSGGKALSVPKQPIPLKQTVEGPLNQIGYHPVSIEEKTTASERSNVYVSGPLNQITQKPSAKEPEKPTVSERNKQVVSGPLNQIGYARDDKK